MNSSAIDTEQLLLEAAIRDSLEPSGTAAINGVIYILHYFIFDRISDIQTTTTTSSSSSVPTSNIVQPADMAATRANREAFLARFAKKPE
jgi:hypothetical protein